MNKETITIQDCMEMYYMKEQSTIINDGKLIGFEKEEIPTQTANP